MPKIILGSKMNVYRDIQVEGFRNVFTMSNVFIDRYRTKHIGVFDKQTRVMFVEAKTVLSAVNKLLIFLADKEQEDIDFFIKVSK